jgi:hypothetical protein
MSVDWTQPYVLIFEWGLFILGWLLVVILSSVVLAIAYAFIRSAVAILSGKGRRSSRKTDSEFPGVKRDIYGRFTL